MSDLVLTSVENGIATLTLNRPQAFNALSEGMLDALQRELDSIAADERVRVVVLAADADFHDTLPIVFPHNPAARERFAADAARRERDIQRPARE